MTTTMSRAERASLRARFDRRVDRSGGPDACHPWLGHCDPQGYGRIKVGETVGYAHRVALLLARRPVPPGKQADHRCHNEDLSCSGGVTCQHRRCCNPRHLRSSTPRANVRAGRSGEHQRRLSAARTHCSRGHRLAGNEYLRHGRRCKTCARIERRQPGAVPRGPTRLIVARTPAEHRLECGHSLPASRRARTHRFCSVCEASAG